MVTELLCVFRELIEYLLFFHVETVILVTNFILSSGC